MDVWEIFYSLTKVQHIMIQVHIKPLAFDEDIKSQLDPIIKAIQATLQKPRLQIDPTKPIVIQVTEEVIQCMGTKEMPAEPILIIPGQVIQCFLPKIHRIITILFIPKKPITISVHDVCTQLAMDLS